MSEPVDFLKRKLAHAKRARRASAAEGAVYSMGEILARWPLPWSVEHLGDTVRVVCRVEDGVGDDVLVVGDCGDGLSSSLAALICAAVNRELGK